MSPKTFRKIFRCGLALAAAFAGLALDENIAKGPSLTRAEAVIGRPLTPMSYAGVARRTTRRAAYAGAYAGAATANAYAYAAPPPVYAAPSCMQTVDAYGRVVTTC
jgi:hypothetical protein